MANTKLKGACHNFGFKPFGAVNRAVVLGAGATGSLPTTGTTLNLGLNWRIKLRVRRSQSYGSYVMQYMISAVDDGLSLIHGFAGDVYELYCLNNATGGVVRLALNVSVIDSAYHDVEFAYAGSASAGTLSGFLDGVAAGTLSVANLAPTTIANAVLELARRPGQGSFTGAVSSLLIEASGVALVNLTFDEESGNALNTGTLGGEMIFTGGGIREIV